MKIRKQFCDLTLDDVRRLPVWEFALDEEGEEGQDEATVRPCETSGALDPSDGPFIVRAAFTLADGTQMHGCLTTPTSADDDLGTLQPVSSATAWLVAFWLVVAQTVGAPGGGLPGVSNLEGADLMLW